MLQKQQHDVDSTSIRSTDGSEEKKRAAGRKERQNAERRHVEAIEGDASRGVKSTQDKELSKVTQGRFTTLLRSLFDLL